MFKKNSGPRGPGEFRGSKFTRRSEKERSSRTAKPLGAADTDGGMGEYTARAVQWEGSVAEGKISAKKPLIVGMWGPRERGETT